MCIRRQRNVPALLHLGIDRPAEIDIYVIDSFGQVQQLSLSFNNDNGKEETETITTPKQ